jgi:hypothetical protein
VGIFRQFSRGSHPCDHREIHHVLRHPVMPWHRPRPRPSSASSIIGTGVIRRRRLRQTPFHIQASPAQHFPPWLAGIGRTRASGDRPGLPCQGRAISAAWLKRRASSRIRCRGTGTSRQHQQRSGRRRPLARRTAFDPRACISGSSSRARRPGTKRLSHGARAGRVH